MCVFEVLRIEDVFEFNLWLLFEVYEVGVVLFLEVDKFEEKWDWIFVLVNEVKKMFLLRVVFEEYL